MSNDITDSDTSPENNTPEPKRTYEQLETRITELEALIQELEKVNESYHEVLTAMVAKDFTKTAENRELKRRLGLIF